jgi:hypothetical protein
MGSPTLSNASIAQQWRHTPPPTSSVIRPNKRKSKFTSVDSGCLQADRSPSVTDSDRFDPIERSKRRAVSPSVQHFREHHRTPSHPRTGISLAIPSMPGSCTSSPITSQGFQFPRNGNMASPTLRPNMLASPIMRPMSLSRSARREEENEREISGAGSAVSGLTLC